MTPFTISRFKTKKVEKEKRQINKTEIIILESAYNNQK